jgi:hypothetical protein
VRYDLDDLYLPFSTSVSVKPGSELSIGLARLRVRPWRTLVLELTIQHGAITEPNFACADNSAPPPQHDALPTLTPETGMLRFTCSPRQEDLQYDPSADPDGPVEYVRYSVGFTAMTGGKGRTLRCFRALSCIRARSTAFVRSSHCGVCTVCAADKGVSLTIDVRNELTMYPEGFTSETGLRITVAMMALVIAAAVLYDEEAFDLLVTQIQFAQLTAQLNIDLPDACSCTAHRTATERIRHERAVAAIARNARDLAVQRSRASRPPVGACGVCCRRRVRFEPLVEQATALQARAFQL